jgi:2,3-diketo-5-methylthio-1-phosphopentane phosphatase
MDGKDASALPKNVAPYPPIHKDAKFVVLSDWDGTITTEDSNDHLTDNYGMGKSERMKLNQKIVDGAITYLDGFQQMLDSVPLTFDECKATMRKNIKLDPGFGPFYKWCQVNDIPFIVVSSGMEPLIRAVLAEVVGEEDAAKVEIISNGIKVKDNGKWNIVFRHPDSGFGHDKSLAILPYRSLPSPPTLFFFGDGVSDVSAAQHADVLFVKSIKKESDLHHYCVKEGIKHILFSSFEEVLPVVKDVVEGRQRPLSRHWN